MKLVLGVLGGLLAASGAAHASLVFEGAQPMTGTGLGAVATVLTLQSHGNATVESGAVGVDAGNMMAISGDAKTGASQTTLRTFGELGMNSVSDLRLFFNANEPGNAKNGISLDNLALSFYSASGSLLWSSGAFTPQAFPTTFAGIGKSGFEFRLDDAQAASAQAALGSDFADVRIGLSASLSDATGGPETFFIASQTTPVPEPSQAALLAAGLLGLGVLVHRRSASRSG